MSWKFSRSLVSRFENHSSRSETGVKRYSKKRTSFSNEVSSNNAKSPFPGQLAESFRLGIYQSILNRAVLDICKIGYFSINEGCCTDFTAVYTVFKLKKWLVMFSNSKMMWSRLYCHLYPRKTNSNQVSRRIIKARGLSLRITHRTELYMALVGKLFRFFVAALGNIWVCALVIFITLYVLIIFSNLNLLVQRSQESSLFSESSAASVSRFEDHSWRSETGVTTCSKKLRSASNVVIVTMKSGISPDI